MDLHTITVDPDEAVAKLAEYESVLARERHATDTAIALAYRAAKAGRPIISLVDTIAAGGYHDNGFPRIAVCRADARECYVHYDTWRARQREQGAFIFADAPSRLNYGAAVGAHTVRVVSHGDVPRRTTWQAHCRLPLIPPDMRPKRPRLSRFHVLWEVESWTPEPPRDPALIRHVQGDLWVVHGVWELTELERLVLGQS